MSSFFGGDRALDARPAAGLGRARSFAALGGLSSFPLSSLRHIARAAALVSGDASVRLYLEDLVAKRDPLLLGRALERLGAEGRLGERWSPEDFYHHRALKKVEPSREARARRTPKRAASSAVGQRAERTALGVIAKYACASGVPANLERLPAHEPSTASPDPLTRYGERLAALNEVLDLLPSVPVADDATSRKLARLAAVRRALVAEIERATRDASAEVLQKVPVLWRSLKRATQPSPRGRR